MSDQKTGGIEGSDQGNYSTGFIHEQSWAARNGFPLWLLAILWVIVAFLLFQLVGNAFAVIYVLAVSEGAVQAFDVDMLLEHMDMIFIGNSISQIIFLGVATWLFVGLSTTGSRSSFMRFRVDRQTLPVVLQTALLILVMQPAIWLLSWLNAQIPMSDSYMAFEETQMDMIKNFLTGDHIVLLTLFHVALVPSVCEEILFRGYLQKALEKSWGVGAAIVISGLLFGLFHIRITQLIPLAVIGILLAWIVWKSNSIIPAIAGHFVNNGGSVLAASLYPEYMMEQLHVAELPSVWLLLGSIGGSAILLRYIHQTTKRE